MDKWYNEDFSEEICVLAIAIVSVFAVYKLGVDSSNIISAAIGGLIGYLKRNEKV